ncbi:MAG TPA: T9SS type A sorting domain-containing protein, partial [Saprospiraceae bacterium]|nr:T9SS type A sorting domain-containing protein [Saprospiraceae bacterium]
PPNHGLGYVESIGMSPSNANIGYMAHYADWLPELSFLKTTDAGENWSIVTTSGIPDTARITKILVDANDTSIVYALTGKARFGCSDPYLYRSTDSGQNWTRIATTLGAILDFDLHPTDPLTIYASTFQMNTNGCAAEMWNYADDVGKTYISTDGGTSFSQLFGNFGGIISVGNDPNNISITDILLDNGTWKTTDGGTSWAHTGFQSDWFIGWTNTNWAYTLSFNGLAKTLVKDRFDPNKLYGSFGQWAWSSTDGGDHVNNISTKEISLGHYLSTGLENVEANALDVNDSDPNSIYLGAYDLGFWYSKDHGASWKRSLPNNTDYPDYTWWDGGGSNCNFVLSDPANASVVWASFGPSQPNTESALFKSTNSGENWVKSNTGLPDFAPTMHGLSIDIQSNTNARKLYLTQGGTVWKSADGGASWTEIFTNNGNGGLKFTEVDKFNGQIIYAGGEAGFFRSTDGGNTWSEVGLSEMRFSTSIPNAVMRPDIVPESDDTEENPPIAAWSGVFEIKADPNIPNRVYVVAHGEGKGLYRSDDAGTNWTKLYTNDEMRGVAISPGNSDIIYTSSSTNYHSGAQSPASLGILVSYDAGATWAFANDGMAWSNGGRLAIESGANPHIWAWVPGTGLQHALIPNFVLPVTVLSPFSARLQDDSVLLQWTTSEEVQNEGFEITRSKDGIQWEALQKIAPSPRKNYKVIDHHPILGLSYYKLTQKDLDGHKTDLGTVSIHYKRNNPPVIYPNPSKGIVHIAFAKKESNRHLVLRLYDNLGRLLLSQNNDNQLNISDLPKGTYHLAIRSNGMVWHEMVVREY